MKVKKAVVPAAGMGTRFLPVTKSMPKEMLPLIDIPAIHYVVSEAVESGIDDIIIITGRGKRAVEDYFDDSPELEMHLEKQGKDDLLELVRDISSLVNVHYIRQKEPRGLPDAIIQAERHVGDEPFAVLLGDDIIKGDKPCTKQLMDVFEEKECSVLAGQEVPPEEISKYGSIKGDREAIDEGNNLYHVKDIVEKPEPDVAPSNIAAIGRYVFTPEFFDCIKKTEPGLHGELQIADSIKILMESQSVYASEFSGKRYDIGDKSGYVKAIIDFALEKSEIKEDIKNYIEEVNR
ncbi:MAG: UTP--glucose-1-phosphate uridylyltransferase GalU [Candidatus Thermoplasmatota archaeon]